MKKSFLVIGLGRFGLGVVKTLSYLNSDIMAIDINEPAVNKASEYISNCAICDSTKMSALKALGIEGINHAVVAIGGNFQATILTVINLKELGVNNITVRIDDIDYDPVMRRLGATDVIIPEEASAVGLAHQIISDSITDYYKVNQEFGVVKIAVKEEFKEKTLVEIDSRNKFDINIVGIFRDNEFMIPKGTDVLEPNDEVMVVGKTKNITKFDQYLNK